MTGPFPGLAEPEPEHAIAPPVDRGMLGQTSAGTLAQTPPPGLPPGEPPETPLSARQAITACCAGSHAANCRVPESEQVGGNESRQRRNSLATDMQAGAIEGKDVQFITQSLLLADKHAATLSHVAA